MKKVLFLLSIIVGTVFSAPHNNPVLQPSIWNGYGVDWCYSTLRVGITNKDSLLEDGWILTDSLTSIYADIDSLHSSHMGLDSLDVLYLYARRSLIDSLDVDSILTASYADLDSLIYMIASGDSINSNIGNIDTLIADSINVGSILATNNIDGNDVHASDSLSFVTGNGTNLTVTNNASANDLIATDSLMAVTGNFSGAVVSASTIAGLIGIFSACYAGSGAWYSTAAYASGLLTAWFYGINGTIISGGTNAARVIIGGPSEAITATSYLASPGGTSTGFLNLLQSPDFTASTGWALSGCAISGGKLNKLTAVGTGTASQGAATMPIVASSTYLIRVDVDSLSAGGSIVVSLGGTTFGSLSSEGSNQWLSGVTTNNSGAFSVLWDSGETGILDNIYVYRLAGKFSFGGEVWNTRQSITSPTYTILTGDNVVVLDHADSIVVTLPSLVDSWNVLTNSGRELVLENSGSGYAVIWANAADLVNNVIMGADSIHLAQYECVTLRAVSNIHWAVQ